MSDTAIFFKPWVHDFNRGKDYLVMNGKTRHCYKEDCYKMVDVENINWWSKPYFAILNEKSTVTFFLEALMHQPDASEASVYVSRYYQTDDVIEKTRALLKDASHYKYARAASCKPGKDTTTITIIPKYSGGVRGRQKLIHILLVSEPDRYGKWKIYSIEEDHSERAGRLFV